MNYSPRLDQLWQTARSSNARHRMVLKELATGTDEDRKRVIPLLVIDGINEWTNFARAFYLSSALGTRAIRGHRITSTLTDKTERGAILSSIVACVPQMQNRIGTGAIDRRYEPKWHDPNVLIAAARAAGLSNYNDIVSAFSPFPKEVMDWACVRNFFAHRNGDTHQSAVRVISAYGIGAAREVHAMLMRPKLGGARPLLWHWWDELEIRAEYLCS